MAELHTLVAEVDVQRFVYCRIVAFAVYDEDIAFQRLEVVAALAVVYCIVCFSAVCCVAAVVLDVVLRYFE